MKTNLTRKITTITEAKEYLMELYKNGESYDIETSAHDIEWTLSKSNKPTAPQCDQLDKLQKQIYAVARKDKSATPFDPIGFIVDLDPEHVAMANADEYEYYEKLQAEQGNTALSFEKWEKQFGRKVSSLN